MKPGWSESALMTSVEQSRFRVGYPNSKPRISRIIALDGRSLAVLRALKDHPWNGARFLLYLRPKNVSEGLPALAVDAVLEDTDGRQTSLIKEIGEADVIVVVASAGPAAEAAEIIGNACSVLGKPATGLLLANPGDGENLAATLRTMRPHAAMLVVSTAEDYVGEMLTALRA